MTERGEFEVISGGNVKSGLANFDVDSEWVHIKFEEFAQFRDVYGFASNEGKVNLEGIRFIPRGRPSKTLLFFMHPSSTLQILPVPRELAKSGAHVLCAGSRYARNDTALIMEKILLDIGAYIRHAKEHWGYEKVVIVGWSGGGSLSTFYQSQAERPTIKETPAGDPVDIVGARLIPADGFIFQAAHFSRAAVLADWIDPSIKDENNPEDRIVELDLYDPRNPNRPPYEKAYLRQFREAQLSRLRRRTAFVKETLEALRRKKTKELERGVLTHRTMAEPRWLDVTIDPNDRKPNWCFLGEPETVNGGPIGLARFSTLRSWLSQWSIDDTRCHAERNAPDITVPFLAVENSADDSVPQPHIQRIYNLVGSHDKTYKVIQGANHYYSGQPEHLGQSVELTLSWLRDRSLVE